MNRFKIFSLTLLIGYIGFPYAKCMGQGTSTLENTFSTIEEHSPYRFFYEKSWIDTITVSTTTSQITTEKEITQLLHQLNLNFCSFDNHFILTGDAPVNQQITIGKSTPGESSYVFEREYRNSEDGEVTIIGNRSEIKMGQSVFVGGFVKNADSGEPIPSAVIYCEDALVSTSSDSRGFYTMKLPTGKHTVTCRFAGMKTEKKSILLFSDGSLSFELLEEPKILDEVTITSNIDADVNNVRMGTSTLNMESLKNVPKVLGENDMIQAALTLPGVQNVGEGAAGINVRGGKTDQNLINLNHATIYNPFHFFGFFSSFNADATSQSELIKSGIPAIYGGRLSSVLDVKMKKASKEKFGAKLGINPVTTKATFEIPIIKQQTSLMVGGRATYSDWILDRVPNETFQNSDPQFYDLSANLSHSYGSGNSINLSGYYSHDRYRLSTDSLNSYSNFSATAEWVQLLGNHLSSDLTVGISRYDFQIDYTTNPELAFDYGFQIGEKFGKLTFNYFKWDAHDLQAGLDTKYYQLEPGQLTPGSASETTATKLEEEKGFERALFISDEYTLSPTISLYGGLRYSFFSPIGPRDIHYYQTGQPKNDGTRTSSRLFENGQFIDTYHGPELRFSSKYTLSKSASVKAGFTQMRQYIHSISNTVSVSPTDTWKLSDPNFKPQRSWQVSLGYYKNLFQDQYECSIEAYYKKMYNLLDYKIGANLVLNENLETEAIQGNGRAYGVEFLLKKPQGKLNGWLSYTYSRSQQQFDSPHTENKINGGNYFPSNFEKPHDISLVSNYKYTRRYSFSLNVAYSTGRPITYPTGKYQLGGVEITHFSDRNGYRIPDYFRVDIGVNIEGSHKVNKLSHSYWSISIYNVLARKNVYSVYFTNENGRIKGYELSVLGSAIPSITYNLKI